MSKKTTLADMRETIRGLEIDDEIIVREGGVQRRYFVVAYRGNLAPEVDLRGVNGAERTLVDGVHTIWMRRTTRGKFEARRVQDVVAVTASADRRQDAVAEPQPIAVDAPEPKPRPITALDLGRLIACSSAEKVAGWVIDQLVSQATTDPRAREIVCAMQVYIVSREKLPGLNHPLGTGL